MGVVGNGFAGDVESEERRRVGTDECCGLQGSCCGGSEGCFCGGLNIDWLICMVVLYDGHFFAIEIINLH